MTLTASLLALRDAPLLSFHSLRNAHSALTVESPTIRKLKSGYRLCSRRKDPKTGKRRNLGTFGSREAAAKREREVRYFKRH